MLTKVFYIGFEYCFSVSLPASFPPSKTHSKILRLLKVSSEEFLIFFLASEPFLVLIFSIVPNTMIYLPNQKQASPFKQARFIALPSK